MDEKKDVSLKEQLVRFNMLWHRYVHYNHGMSPYDDIHRGQGRVLSILKMKPKISQKELSYLLDMRSQSLGELLAKLEKKEFITRTPSDSDRRAMVIKLTEKGAETANAPKEDSDSDKIFDCLNETEQKQLAKYLFRLTNEIEKSFAEENINEECFRDFRRERADFLLRGHGHMHMHGGHWGCEKHHNEDCAEE